MKFKRLLPFISCCLLALCCLVLPVRADTVAAQGNTTLVTFLREHILAGESPITFPGELFGYPSMEEIEASVEKVYHDPELFILQRSGSWNISAKGDRYTLTLPYYEDILADYANAKSFYNKSIKAIASQADNNWSELQKVLFVNDYMAQNFRYDTAVGNYDAYSLLRDGRGVCEAYTLLTTALLQRLGLRCSYVSSESLNHTWNLVRVDGAWYHLDTTWNDPEPDRPGYAGHRFFLLSTESLRKSSGGEHFKKADWEFGRDVECTSTLFENQFFTQAVSPFVLLNGKWYFVSEQGLNRWNGKSDKAESVLSFAELFQKLYPNYSFQGYAACSGLFELNGKLIFNTSFNIIAWDPDTGNTTSIVDALSGGNIGGCALYEENKVLFSLQRESGSTVYYQSIPAELFPGGEVPGKAEQPEEEQQPQQPAGAGAGAGVGGFTDVHKGDWYADAVTWALSRNITTGTSDTTFSPDQKCTRAQILTFLWRAEGSPAVDRSASFSDVKDTDYYSGAAKWAKAWGLILGSKLNGGEACTRKDTVLLLWRLAGMPAADSAVRFSDVESGSALGSAVSWALSRGITSGTSDTTFSPEMICTRAQIVTFLNRYYTNG
ncbi:MAG: S-layer homology domain-containing protein [Oscillospiraceae bacterium]|nr:S-layer homology domain-containing protein [Oscillospiraceae bacterium]